MVLPVATPVTMPKPSTLATAALAVLQVPPATDGLKTTDEPTQTPAGPVSVPGEVIGAIVTGRVATAVEHAVDTE